MLRIRTANWTIWAEMEDLAYLDAGSDKRISRRRNIRNVGDVRAGSVKRVASAVGEGSIVGVLSQ